jgi:signal transduction histidine kinase
MGLVGMFERAELLGASLEISSEPGNGTFLSLEVPVGQKSSSERLSNQSD